MNKRIIVLIVLVAAVFVVPASAELVDAVGIRGTVMEDTVVNLVWDATNFAAFWYDLDDGIFTEELTIAGALNDADRTIDMDALTYSTHPEYQQYEINEAYGVLIEGDSGYYLEGWLAEKYVAVNGNADLLSKLLVEFEGDDKMTLATGEAWDLGGGFALTAQQIDLEGGRVWFSLSKDGKELDSEVIDSSAGVSDQKRTYSYTDDIDGVDDVPVFHCYVDAVYRGTDTNIVQVTHVFLIDNVIMDIDIGDTFGVMEVTTASSDWVSLTNKDGSIELGCDTTEHIMGDMYFKTADDVGVLRFYPFVERTIGGEEPTPPQPGTIPDTDTDGDGVPDAWDLDNSTPAGYWVNSQGIGRMWGDMNGDGWLTSVDALMILQAAAEKTGL
ncbi:MAG: hypothetical protein EF813_12035 [Methanosarcinales archaeon]|nr:MAG: hypothetical protein EF813_12035 [Methanosarcinales archaeon]